MFISRTFTKEIVKERKDENWFLPICYLICSELRLCAKAVGKREIYAKIEYFYLNISSTVRITLKD